MSASTLRAVFLEERAMLLRLLTARLRNAEDAEDVLQELWLKLAQVEGEAIRQPGPFLFKMASNLALDRRRSAMRGAVRDGGWLAVQPAAAEFPDAERAMLASERLRRVEAAVAALPDRTGQAFRLYRLKGLSRPRIADEMGISVSGVEKLLHRAYRHIHDFERAAGVESGGSRHLDATEVSGRDE